MSMSRRHGKTAYPFSVVAGQRNAFESKVVRSNDEWIEYWLTPKGWYFEKESPDGGVTSEGVKTVRRVVQETEIPDVIALTTAALDAAWISESNRDEIARQVDDAQ